MSAQSVNDVVDYFRENTLDGITQALGILFFHVMLITGSVQIVNRFVDVSIGLYWVGEVTRIVLVFLTLTALPYLFVNNLDISFLPVVEKLPERQYNVVLVVRNLLVLLIAAVMIWSSYLSFFQSGDITLPTIRWFFIRWIYAFMGVAFSFLLLYTGIDTARRIHTLAGNSGEREDV